MLVAESEVTRLAELIDAWADAEGDARAELFMKPGYDRDAPHISSTAVYDYLTARPHLLLAAGFAEVRAATSGLAARVADSHDRLPDEWLTVDGVGPHHRFSADSGITYTAYLPAPDPAVVLSSRKGKRYALSTDPMLERLRVLSVRPDAVDGQISWPDALGLNPLEATEASRVSALAAGLVRQLWSNKLFFRDLSWDQLEDVVAELARGLGLRVLQTRRSADGGRDVVVQGELLPGVHSTAAIEVTAQRRVPRGKVSKAQWDNRHFPLTIVATSGTFSAGVLQERTHEEHALRLHLAEGALLQEWVLRYGRSQGWDGRAEGVDR